MIRNGITGSHPEITGIGLWISESERRSKNNVETYIIMYAAQAILQIDTDRAEKDPLRSKTNRLP
jgi:hypothetical protein